MNIFWLSLNIELCARYHCDKHIYKMILEYASMLSTTHRILDYDENSLYNRAPLYKKTHANHPCTKWVRETSGNYNKLYELFYAVCKEYTYRRGRVHLTEEKLLEHLKELPKNIPIGEMTVPPVAITNDDIKVRNEDGKVMVIASYRNYYNIEKRRFATWNETDIPNWFSEYKANLTPI
jgi:hypothetical protein